MRKEGTGNAFFGDALAAMAAHPEDIPLSVRVLHSMAARLAQSGGEGFPSDWDVTLVQRLLKGGQAEVFQALMAFLYNLGAECPQACAGLAGRSLPHAMAGLLGSLKGTPVSTLLVLMRASGELQSECSSPLIVEELVGALVAWPEDTVLWEDVARERDAPRVGD